MHAIIRKAFLFAHIYWWIHFKLIHYSRPNHYVSTPFSNEVSYSLYVPYMLFPIPHIISWERAYGRLMRNFISKDA
jgi:hypothetical protein